MKYIVPEFDNNVFNCPSCGAYARQIWKHYSYDSSVEQVYALLKEYRYLPTMGSNSPVGKKKKDLSISLCSSCEEHSVWLKQLMIFPHLSTAPLPTKNMPKDVLIDYNEASKVLITSPRSSAALLRLAVQKLCINLGGKGKNINADIKYLVEKGLPERIQKALDIVRVVGNNAVHPGQINIKDDPEIANALFKMINLIVDTMINEPLEIDELYDILPEGSKEQIERRDS